MYHNSFYSFKPFYDWPVACRNWLYLDYAIEKQCFLAVSQVKLYFVICIISMRDTPFGDSLISLVIFSLS